MKTLLLALLLAIAPAAWGQQAAAPVVPTTPVVDAQSMQIRWITAPTGMSRQVLEGVMVLYRRDILVKNTDGTVSGPVRNMSSTPDGFVVYDAKDFVDTVKAAVDTTLGSVAPPSEPALRIATYAPRNVDVNRLAEALEPLRRKVLVPGQGNLGADVRQNLSFQASPALLSLQDTPEQVARMLSLLAEVDQPAPQFLLQGLVLAESGSGEDDAALPAELLDNLHRLLPIKGFTQLATALVRASVEPGQEQFMAGELSTGEVFQIKLLPGGVDLPNGRISMQRLGFECAGQSFETSAVIALGEYTVIGGVGSNPKLVVLRVSSLGTK